MNSDKPASVKAEIQVSDRAINEALTELPDELVKELPKHMVKARSSLKPYTLSKKIEYYGVDKEKDDEILLDDEQADRLRASGHIA